MRERRGAGHEPKKNIDFGGGYWELAWLVGAKEAGELATADAAHPGAWLPLWSAQGRPLEVQEDYANLDDLFQSDPVKWGFWERWFKGMHDGEPLSWALSSQIAETLTARDWLAGARHVAEKIQELEALYLVRQALSDLKSDQRITAHRSRFSIGGNNPPEELELPEQLTGSQTIIWAAVVKWSLLFGHFCSVSKVYRD